MDDRGANAKRFGTLTKPLPVASKELITRLDLVITSITKLPTKINKMELKGKIVKELTPIQGEKKDGTSWKKKEIIIETNGEYPKKVCVSLWGANADLPTSEGTEVTAHIDIESREYNDRWYTDVKAWKLDTEDAQSPSPNTDTNDLEPDLPF